MIPRFLDEQGKLFLGVRRAFKALCAWRVNLVGGIVWNEIHSVGVLENLVKQRVLVPDRGSRQRFHLMEIKALQVLGLHVGKRQILFLKVWNKLLFHRGLIAAEGGRHDRSSHHLQPSPHKIGEKHPVAKIKIVGGSLWHNKAFAKL